MESMFWMMIQLLFMTGQVLRKWKNSKIFISTPFSPSTQQQFIWFSTTCFNHNGSSSGATDLMYNNYQTVTFIFTCMYI
jgi:hypothetical protein